jgi:esterase/lipase superfamily enzyme
MIRNFPTTFRFLASSIGAIFITANMAQAGVGDQLAKLLASDGAAGDRFGFSVSISGTTAIVGALFDDDNGTSSGSAYLFDTVTGLQTAKLLASDGAAGDKFGESVSISGTTAIVSAADDDDIGPNSGSAYLFDTVTGLQIAKLQASDGAAAEGFARAVSISGTTAIVGARTDDDNGFNSGSAYLFDTVTGLQIAKLLASDGAFGNFFGHSVSISGTTAIVGAFGDDDNGSISGSAYLFDTVTGLQISKLLASDGAADDFFGTSVSISGTTAIVGALGNDDNGSDSGSAYLFDTVTGLQIAKLLASDGAAGDLFGASVSISGTTAIVSARADGDNGFNSGSAYLFDTVTGLQIAKLLASDGAAGDLFGHSVSISGTRAIVGAFENDDNGSAYLFEAFQGLPVITSDVPSISLGTGGSQVLTIQGGPTQAGWTYFTFGSVTGTTPGIDFGGGVVLPLNFDVYMNLTIFKPSLGAFGNFRGTLDGSGQAVATFTFPALMDPSLIGVTINHACLTGAILGVADSASNAVPVLLTP